MAAGTASSAGADWRLPPHQGLSAGRAGSPATLMGGVACPHWGLRSDPSMREVSRLPRGIRISRR